MPLVNSIGPAKKNLTVTVQALDGSNAVQYNGVTARSLTVPAMERIEALEEALSSAVSTGYLLSPLATSDGDPLYTRGEDLILAGVLATSV